MPETVLVILFEYLFPGAFDHGEETDDDTTTLSDFSSSLEDYWCVLALSRCHPTLHLRSLTEHCPEVDTANLSQFAPIMMPYATRAPLERLASLVVGTSIPFIFSGYLLRRPPLFDLTTGDTFIARPDEHCPSSSPNYSRRLNTLNEHTF